MIHFADQCFEEEPSGSTESVIEFPIHVNAEITDIENDFENAQAGEIRYHVAPGSSVPIPVYCAEPKPFDAQTALKNTVMCPVRYLSKAPPTMVTDNYCFIIDGDIVDFEEINREATDWWKDTSTATRYYCSDSLKTFHQVTMLMAQGKLKTAYRTRLSGAGMEQVPLEKVFRVSRYFSYWKTCHNFHRIISLVSPVIESGEKTYGFQKRIFVQYLWRTEKDIDREKVALEYAASMYAQKSRKRLNNRGSRNSNDFTPPVPGFLS
uniref:Uncharacterized protein n=1 Tax=Acrobeloides nanus TaxID=290746 RepID=A0A914DXR1_9BILA